MPPRGCSPSITAGEKYWQKQLAHDRREPSLLSHTVSIPPPPPSSLTGNALAASPISRAILNAGVTDNEDHPSQRLTEALALTHRSGPFQFCHCLIGYKFNLFTCTLVVGLYDPLKSSNLHCKCSRLSVPIHQTPLSWSYSQFLSNLSNHN